MTFVLHFKTCIPATIMILHVSASVLAANSLRDIDFANYAYDLPQLGPDDAPEFRVPEPSMEVTRVQLRSGRFKEFDPDGLGWEPVKLVSTQFGDLDGDGRDEAVVALDQYGGGTLRWGYIFIFASGKSALVRQMAVFMTGDRATDGLRNVSVVAGELVIDLNMYEESIADCCSTLFRRLYFKWNGDKFQKVREQRRLPIPGAAR